MKKLLVYLMRCMGLFYKRMFLFKQTRVYDKWLGLFNETRNFK